MKLYDHRKRIMKQYDQDDEYVIVPRYRCLKNSCNKIHTALPSCLIPHKHYAVHIIEETIDEYNSESLMTADYPCESTCIRWIRWMKQLNSQIDAHLKSIGSIREHIGFSICKFWLNGAEFPIKMVQKFWNNGTSFTDERCAFFIL